jgi:hypothetical protein
MHDPVLGSLAKCTVGRKLDVILAVRLVDKMLESILVLAVALMVVPCAEYVELSKRQRCGVAQLVATAT